MGTAQTEEENGFGVNSKWTSTGMPRDAALPLLEGASGGLGGHAPGIKTSPSRQIAVALFVLSVIAGTTALVLAAARGDRPGVYVELSQANSGVANLAQEETPAWCEKETGGTCVLSECWAWRNATCAWGMCFCPSNTCASTDGACHARAAAAQRVARYSPTWVRQQIGTVFDWAPAIAAMLRADLPGIVFSPLAVGMWGRVEPRATEFRFGTTWNEARRDYGYSECDAVLVGAAKYLFWHCMQPVAFFIVFYAYSGFLGWLQYSLALVVIVREMMYLALIHVGICACPAFLMIQPFTEREQGLRLTYFAVPYAVILQCLAGDDVVSCDGCIFAFLASDLCALLSLAIGLTSGSMFPSMAVGYAMASISIPVLFCWGVRG